MLRRYLCSGVARRYLCFGLAAALSSAVVCETQSAARSESGSAFQSVLATGSPHNEIAAIPTETLPSQQPQVPADASLPPKVITNPVPAMENKVGATEVLDASPETTETVHQSSAPILIEKTVNPNAPKRFQVKKVEQRKTMALALGGGGARGAAHIGVLRVLEQEGIPIDYIVGNSMGAIVGGLYASGLPLDKLEKTAVNGHMGKEYIPRIKFKAILMPLSKIIPDFGEKQYAGLVSGKKFERCLEHFIPEGKNSFESLKVPFSAVATNLRDGKAYRISEGKLSTAIRASATISPLLKPVKIGEHVYTDGGVRANLPASSARDTGADVVVAVLVDEPLRLLPESNFHSYKGITARLADIVLAVTDEHQLQFADVVINPDVSGIPILSDDPAHVLKAIRSGEEAARKALPALRKAMKLNDHTRLVETGDGTRLVEVDSEKDGVTGDESKKLVEQNGKARIVETKEGATQ